MDPLVPVTVTVLVPAAADEEAANWTETFDGVPVGENDERPEGIVVTPAGSPDTLNRIVPLNPFSTWAEITWV